MMFPTLLISLCQFFSVSLFVAKHIGLTARLFTIKPHVMRDICWQLCLVAIATRLTNPVAQQRTRNFQFLRKIH